MGTLLRILLVSTIVRLEALEVSRPNCRGSKTRQKTAHLSIVLTTGMSGASVRGFRAGSVKDSVRVWRY